MARFGMNLSLSEQELLSVEHIFQAADSALVLTNDYYSWDRENAVAARTGSGRIVNCVEMYMRTKSISVSAAKELTKRHIIAYEKEYVSRKTQFYQRNPDVSQPLRRWIEVAGVIIAGNHYWCTRCPRHHEYLTPDCDDDSPISVPEETTSSDRASKTSSASTSSVPNSDDGNSSDSAGDREVQRDALTNNRILDATNTTHESSSGTWPHVDTSVIREPCKYIESMPSKGIRKSLIDALNDWFRVPKSSLKIIEEIIKLLHDASLILDDIEDNSSLRRGRPAVHTIFGHSQAINSANFMFVQAVAASRQLRSSKALDVLLEDLERLYAGQSLDLDWKFTLHCPSEEEYLTMVDHKTGGMFRMLAGLLRTETRRFEGVSFDKVLLLFGRFFQIRDDYMNLTSGQYEDQKGFCEDLDEGKFSYPVVHCLQHSKQFKSQVLSMFRQRSVSLGAAAETMSIESKRYLLGCLEEAGSLEATLSCINNLECELEAEIGKLEASTGEENPMLRLLLKRLSLQDNINSEVSSVTSLETFELPESNQRILGEPHPPETVLPLAYRPSGDSSKTSLDCAIDAVKALQTQGQVLTKQLAVHGALLFRGLPIHDSNDFSRFVHAFGFKPHELIGNVKGGGELAPAVSYANEAPPHVQIYSHNESAHVPNAPGYIMFYGHRVPELGNGGESPMSSSLELYHRANAEMPEFIAELAEKGCLSKISYKTSQQYPGGSTLLEAFGKDVLNTDDKATRRAKMEAQIKRYNRGEHTTWEWTDAGNNGTDEEILTLTHRVPALRTQAQSGYPTLFTGLAAYWKNLQLRLASDDGLAKKRGGQMQQLYGDGSVIQDEYLAKLASITDDLRVLHSWHRGDVLVFDNTIAQHGRQPWVGEQEDRVIMASLWDGELPGAYNGEEWAQVVQPSL